MKNIVIERFTDEVLTDETRAIFETLADSEKLQYSTMACQSCGARLDREFTNKIITEGVPSICQKHYTEMQQSMETLSQLFSQMS